MKSRKPIRRVSTKRAKELAQYRKIKARLFKLNPSCQACLNVFPADNIRPATDIHHTHGKVGKLLCYEPLFKLVCRSCHRWITNHTEMARELGLVCEKGQWNNQSLIPKNYYETMR